MKTKSKSIHFDCPFHLNPELKDNPKNTFVAHAHQLHEHAVMLLRFGLANPDDYRHSKATRDTVAAMQATLNYLSAMTDAD